jgi:hypothetical protein
MANKSAGGVGLSSKPEKKGIRKLIYRSWSRSLNNKEYIRMSDEVPEPTKSDENKCSDDGDQSNYPTDDLLTDLSRYLA